MHMKFWSKKTEEKRSLGISVYKLVDIIKRDGDAVVGLIWVLVWTGL